MSLKTLAAAIADRYVIERELGQGGMAIVYLAMDIRHDRRVALKVLNPELVAAIGAERFLQEIKTTANLQHPHIVPLHDSGVADGVVYYVMPYVEGEGLRDRLNRERQLPIADAVRIAAQVASAIDYAHRHGVIHRDIKPENILLHDGSAVVADFGIALAVESAGGQRLTQTGLSLGTPQYMAPEQAMGERTLDGRADIYSLGAVLYEMISGEPPFTGPTIQAIVARTLSEDPRPLTVQRRATPPSVDAAVQRALEKLPADRFATAGEFAQALTSDVTSGRPTVVRARNWNRVTLAFAAIAFALAGVQVWSLTRARSLEMPVVTSRIVPAAGAPSELHDVALSPDGATLAYVSSYAVDGGRIWLRNLSDASATPLRDTEGARRLFWAPDGTGIGFFAGGSLRVVMLATGAVKTLAPASEPAGAAWGPDGTILYSPVFRGIYRVPASGGTPAIALKVGDDSTPGSRDPRFLPDGHHFLYWHSADDGIWVGDLATGVGRRLAEHMTSPVYVAPGYLLFFQNTAQVSLEQPAPLYAQRFDADRLVFSGEPILVSQRVDRPDQVPIVSATRDFLIVRESPLADTTRSAAGAHGTIYWLDRATGKRSEPVKGTGSAWAFRASHSGRSFVISDPGLSVYDAERDVSVRLPIDNTIGGWPQVWSPDDRFIAFNAGPRVLIASVDGRTPLRSFASSTWWWKNPMDWTVDGYIYYVNEPTDSVPKFHAERYNVTTEKHEVVRLGSGSTLSLRTSSDGQWIAYESDESGQHEIYLASAHGAITPIRVSKAGGGSPAWRADDKELFWLGGDGRITSASLTLGATPVVGEPKRVADLVIHPEPMGFDPYLDTRFVPTPKGDRFLVQTPLGAGTHELTLMQGWQRRLKATERR